MFIKEFKGNVEIGQDTFNMLKSCLSTDTMRTFLCHVYIEDGKITATDGHVLVQYSADMELQAEGFYELAKVGKKYLLLPVDYDGTPPNYAKVIPDYDVITTESISISGKANVLIDSITICQIIHTTGNNYNLDYLWNIKHLGAVDMYSVELGKAVLFKGQDFVYVVMPIVRED